MNTEKECGQFETRKRDRSLSEGRTSIRGEAEIRDCQRTGSPGSGDRKRLEKSFRKRNRTDWWSDDKKKKKPVKISKKL